MWLTYESKGANMVSIQFSVPTLLFASLSFLNGQGVSSQSPETTGGFLQPTKAESTAQSPRLTPQANLTPEMRGDILMARKQYREAIDAYELRYRAIEEAEAAQRL